MKRICGILIFFLLVPVLLSGQERMTVVKYRYYLLTSDGEALAKAVKKYASDTGGFMKYYSGNMVTIRVPAGKAPGFRAFARGQTYIVDEQVYREDVTEKLIDLRTRLSVKMKLLKDLYALFNASKFHQTLDVEKEIGNLIMEIESIKGEIGYYEDVSSLSEITVNINLKHVQKSSIKKRVSDFMWINGLGVSGMVDYWEAK